jgi:hypothetical protein
MTQGCPSNLGYCPEPATVVRELLIVLRDATVELDDVRVLRNGCGFVTGVKQPRVDQCHLATKLIRRAVDAHYELS